MVDGRAPCNRSRRLAAILHARSTGQEQVVDAAIVKGAAVLMAPIYSLLAAGDWADEREANVLDSGAPFYDIYETADGRHVVIGPMEAPFYHALLERLGGADDSVLQHQYDRALWPEQRIRLAAIFRTRTRAEWDAVLGGSDACYAPVLSMTLPWQT